MVHPGNGWAATTCDRTAARSAMKSPTTARRTSASARRTKGCRPHSWPDRGADDYVTNPFPARELAARIGAMRRRPACRGSHRRPGFAGLSIDPNAREVRLDGQLLDLTKIEFDLLTKLASEPRRVFARQQLLDAVWGADWYGDDHVVDVHGQLAQKLGSRAATSLHSHCAVWAFVSSHHVTGAMARC